MTEEPVGPQSEVVVARDDASAPLTREQLYELVWQEPMLRIGERLGVSSSYMARVCTELRVEAEEQHRKLEEEDCLRREAQARALLKKRRQEARADLLSAIVAWDEACRIEAYFADVERVTSQLDADQRERLQGRIALAKELVGASDPVELLLRWKAPKERR